MFTEKQLILEDGQRDSLIDEWRKRMRENAEASLSVLSLQLERLQAAQSREAALVCLGEWRNALLNLHTLLGESASRFSPPQGFFIRDSERTDALKETERLVLRAEEAMQPLRNGASQMGVLYRALQDGQNELIGLSLSLYAARRAAEGERSVQDTLDVLTARSEYLAEQHEQVYRRFSSCYLTAQAFCAEIWVEFRMRLEKLSDAEHDGAACNPTELARLCVELQRVIDRDTLPIFSTEQSDMKNGG